MPRTKGSSDKAPRQRRSMTEKEKEKRKSEKEKQEQRQAQRAKLAFLESFTQQAPANEEEPQAPANEEEPQVHYHDINSHDYNGSSNLGNINAEYDDDWDETEMSSGNEESDMKSYMKAILARFEKEASDNFLKKNKHETMWLHEYLKEHGFWLRAECAPTICKKLRIKQFDKYYYRDIRVWFPDEEFGKGLCMPVCVTCKSNTGVRMHSYPKDHPGRRVATFDTHFFIMSRQYLCTECKKEHEGRKATANGQPFEKVQYTFMGDHQEVLKHLPDDVSTQFPAVLTHRAGISVPLARSLRPLVNKSAYPEAISEWLLELHSLKHITDNICYEMQLERQRRLFPHLEMPMFSKFDDKCHYSGAVPSASYLASVLKLENQQIRPFLDREVKKISFDHLKIDASHKAPKKLSQYHGKRAYEVIQTGVTEISQIRVQALGGSDSHEQLEPALHAMLQTQKEYGKPGPSLLTTDNVPRDKDFAMRVFPLLREKQKILDEIANEMNRADVTAAATNSSVAAVATNSASTTLDADSTSTTNSDSTDHHGALNCNLEQQATLPLALERIQVVESSNIDNKIEALSEAMEGSREGNAKMVYAIDCEWDTQQSRRGEHRFKVGKVAIMQIGYKLHSEGAETNALLLKLPRRGPLPKRLVAFLEDENNVFVGIGISSDVKHLAKDYSIKRLEKTINTRDLALMARERDVVQRGNHSLKDLVHLVLGMTVDKDNAIRCSKWSTPKLSTKQKEYAAYDVIYPLEMYFKLAEMPDLSQRLDPDQAVAGSVVDIVPPHARNNRQRAAHGYNVGDLATRAAIGRILAVAIVENSNGILPANVKAGKGTVVVEISGNVLAPSLLVPGYYTKKSGRRQSVTLGDLTHGNGQQSFRVILPLSMLRVHDDSCTVRTFRGQTQPHWQRRITRPAPSPSTKTTDSTPIDANVDDTNKESDLENDPENDSSKMDGDLLDMLSAEDDIDVDGNDESNDINLLEAITEAALAAEHAVQAAEADMTDLNAKLVCDELDDPPEQIEHKFSAILGDVFHAMDRTRVPVRHEYKKAYFVALMRAFFVWNQSSLDKVIEKLKQNGWSEEDVQSLLYFRPSFFRRRVERIVLSPKQLYWRVRAVYKVFGNKKDSKTGTPLFNKLAWGKANGVLKEILQGHFSDPPGHNFYQIELDGDGSPKKDKYGLTLIHCSRGTNSVENIHKHYNTTFRHTVGFELGDGLLAERRHRHNLKMAEKRIPDHPHLGHYNTWLVDKLQTLVERNHGVLLYPSWVSATDFRDTDESFVTVAIHSEELDKALKEQIASIENFDDVKKTFTKDQQFQCQAHGVPIPFLPVDTKEEQRLFTHLVLSVLKGFDANEMALLWMKKVDGVHIYPKYPHDLRKYHKTWERSRRVRTATRKLKSDAELLEILNQNELPPELATQDDDNNMQICNDDDDDDDDFGMVDNAGDGEPTSTPYLQCVPQASLPLPMEQPPMQALMPYSEIAALHIGTSMVGAPPWIYQPAQAIIALSRGQRGEDQLRRRKRSCAICRSLGKRRAEAEACKGKTWRARCPFYDFGG